MTMIDSGYCDKCEMEDFTVFSREVIGRCPNLDVNQSPRMSPYDVIVIDKTTTGKRWIFELKSRDARSDNKALFGNGVFIRRQKLETLRGFANQGERVFLVFMFQDRWATVKVPVEITWNIDVRNVRNGRREIEENYLIPLSELKFYNYKFGNPPKIRIK